MPAPNSASAILGTAAANVFAVPAGQARYITGIHMANTTGGGVTATVQYQDASDANTVIVLAPGVSIGANDAKSGMIGPLILMEGDVLQAFSDTAAAVHVTVSYYDEALA